MCVCVEGGACVCVCEVWGCIHHVCVCVCVHVSVCVCVRERERGDNNDRQKPCLYFAWCVQLLTKSLEVVDTEDWTAELGEALGNQVGHYVNCPQEKVSGQILSEQIWAVRLSRG